MRKPLPIKVSTLGGSAGSGQFTPEEAIAETQRLLARANQKAMEEMGHVEVQPRFPPKNRMNDTDKIRFALLNHRWPSQAEMDGWR